ncbi:MAG TPA: GNAT family N-acetyltransferase [Chitinophaga sp.]
MMDTIQASIVNTTEADKTFIYWLFDQAISYQQKNGYPAWKGYDKDALQTEIANHLQFKIVNGQDILGVFSISYSDPGTWGERDTGNALFLHRTITNPNFKGQKVFEKIRNWAIQFAREKHLGFIRMDTWTDNPQLIAYYQSHGFQVVAERRTPDVPELPEQNRNLNVTLLEMKIE